MTEPVAPIPAAPAPAPEPAAAVDAGLLAPETGAPPDPHGPDAPVPSIRRKNRMRLSLVWVVPIVALLVGASLLVRNMLAVGPRIEIEFRNAESLEPGKTEVRYKEVVIGRVESVSLRDDRKHVIATVQLSRAAASIAVQDTGFWVVRPRVGLAGVSGLGTLFSGSYIGVDAGTSLEPKTQFIGLEAPPFVLRGEPGRSFVLRAADLGSLDVGSPVLYRRTQVGRVVGYTLSPEHDELSVKVFIEAPYDRLVTMQSRFWNASGVDLTLNASGLTLNTQTLASVIVGAVAFEQASEVTDVRPAAAGSQFSLFRDRRTALAPPDGPAQSLRMVFQQSVRGLTVGAPVDFLGIEIGNVRGITLQHDVKANRFPVQVIAEIFPLRLGAVRTAVVNGAGTGNSAEARVNAALLQRLVDSGLRAQLRTGNLLTGQLFVALDFMPKLARAAVTESDGVITLPTVAGTLSELQPQIAEIVQKISKLPFDDIARGVQSTLSQVGAAVTTIGQLTPEAQKALAEVQRTLTDVQRTLGAAQTTMQRLDRNLLDETAPLQRNVEQTLSELQRAAQSLRVLTDYLQLHPEALLRGKPADPPTLPDKRTP
jgi:paraquat-inducible protein B